MSFTLIDHKAICAAIAMGQLSVQYADKRVQYRSMAELLQAKAVIEGELIANGLMAAPQSGGVERGGTTYAAYCPD
ncbi:phage head-tail joining protein [Roseateles sp. P5_E7]